MITAAAFSATGILRVAMEVERGAVGRLGTAQPGTLASRARRVAREIGFGLPPAAGTIGHPMPKGPGAKRRDAVEAHGPVPSTVPQFLSARFFGKPSDP